MHRQRTRCAPVGVACRPRASRRFHAGRSRGASRRRVGGRTSAVPRRAGPYSGGLAAPGGCRASPAGDARARGLRASRPRPGGAGSGNDPTTGPHPRTEGASTFVKTLLTPDSHQIHVSAHAYTTRSREGGERRGDGRKTALLTRLRPRLAQPPSSPTRQNCATDSTKHTPSPRP